MVSQQHAGALPSCSGEVDAAAMWISMRHVQCVGCEQNSRLQLRTSLCMRSCRERCIADLQALPSHTGRMPGIQRRTAVMHSGQLPQRTCTAATMACVP